MADAFSLFDLLVETRAFISGEVLEHNPESPKCCVLFSAMETFFFLNGGVCKTTCGSAQG